MATKKKPTAAGNATGGTISIKDYIEQLDLKITTYCDNALDGEEDAATIQTKRAAQQRACYALNCIIGEAELCTSLTGEEIAYDGLVSGTIPDQLQSLAECFTPGKDVTIKNECYQTISQLVADAINYIKDIN